MPSWNSSISRCQHHVEVILLVHSVHIRRCYRAFNDVLGHVRRGRKKLCLRAVNVRYSLPPLRNGLTPRPVRPWDTRIPCPHKVFRDVLQVQP